MTFALAVTPVGSLAQESTYAPSNPPSEEAQNTTKTTPSTPAQTQTPNPTPATQSHPSNLENTVEATEPLPRDLVHWNEYQGPHFTIRAGAVFFVDFAAFAQDAASKEQIAMLPEVC